MEYKGIQSWSMDVQPEIYKGIEFIRISALPEDQKGLMLTSLPSDKIIKILKDNVLLNDCVQYSDYVQWMKEIQKQEAGKPQTTTKENPVQPEFKLAYK
jgi:hypothetical protein